MRRKSTLAAAMVTAMIGGQGCVTGYRLVKSESFRDDCADGGDTCPKAVAIEALAELGAVALIAGSIAIANAIEKDDEASPPTSPTRANRLTRQSSVARLRSIRAGLEVPHSGAR